MFKKEHNVSSDNIEFDTGTKNVNENFIDFFLSRLNEESSFEQIRQVAKIAIANGMTMSSRSKKIWVLSSLENLEALKNISIKMQTIILAAIEVVVLSRRISNLKYLGIFSKNVDENNNHCWLLDGAQLVISMYYPQLTVHYLRGPGDPSEINNIKKNLSKNEAIWIVVGYQGNYHLTLVRVQFTNRKLKVHLFDSVGALPNKYLPTPTEDYDVFLYELITNIKIAVEANKEIIKVFSKYRQIDSTNCFSFVLSDLTSALKLFEEGEKLFFNKDEKSKTSRNIHVKRYTALAPSFYKISQSKKHTPQNVIETWETPIKSEKEPEYGNPEALWISAKSLATLVKNEKIIFRPEHYHEFCGATPKSAQSGLSYNDLRREYVSKR